MRYIVKKSSEVTYDVAEFGSITEARAEFESIVSLIRLGFICYDTTIQLIIEEDDRATTTIESAFYNATDATIQRSIITTKKRKH